MKAATISAGGSHMHSSISIHAAREGGDAGSADTAVNNTDISIHAAREGGDDAVPLLIQAGIISIHAAREGGDEGLEPTDPAYQNFNPRRP